MKHIVPALRRNLNRSAGRETPMVGQKRPTHDGHVPSLKLSVASYNVHKCIGTDGVFDPDRVLDVVLELDADIIALQEADERFGHRKGLLNLKALHERGGYRSVLDEGSRRLSHGWHGNVVLYREGLVTGVTKMKLPGFEPRGAVLVDFDVSGMPLRIIGAHLGLLASSRARQAQAILNAAHHPVDDRAIILLGDTNEWRVGGRSALAPFDPHLSDVDMAIASFPSRFPLWPLDRVLTNKHVTVYEMFAVETQLARIASDHLPVKAVIGVTEPAAVCGQSPGPL